MEKILMGGVVGFVLFTLVSYLLIVLSVPLLIIPITLLAATLLLKPLVKTVKQIKIKFDRTKIIIFLVFLFGIAGQMLVISPSGSSKNGDLLFWSAHGHDGPWHIALMEEIKRGYPFQNPVFAGEKLINYHFFSDIAPAIISKYLPVSDLNLYFRIFPFIYSLFLGASAYFLTKEITKSRLASIWATIFTYFAGSFGYVIGRGESVFWATQIQSASGNPPQIISDFIMLAFFYFFFKLINEKYTKLTFWICILLAGTLAEFKVYAAIVLLGSLVLAGIWQILRERKTQLLLLAVLSGILAAVLYLPNSSGTTSFLIFQPWWYIRTMIVEPSRLNLLDWELRRQTYIYEHNWKRVIFLEGLGFIIFFFGNLGMRFLGLWDILKSLKTVFKNYFSITVVSVILLSIILPLMFLQKGVASNTSQFLQYFILLFGILAGITASKIIRGIKLPFVQIIISVLLIATMIPTQIILLRDFYSRPAFAKISQSEMEALNFISNNTVQDAIVISPGADLNFKLTGPTPNIWAWMDTGYVAAFSKRRNFFADKEQVDIMGYDYKERENLRKIIFESTDPAIVEESTRKTGAEILYYPKALSPKTDFKKLGFSLIFENSEASVWKIK